MLVKESQCGYFRLIVLFSVKRALFSEQISTYHAVVALALILHEIDIKEKIYVVFCKIDLEDRKICLQVRKFFPENHF
jgi:hypothetical protein